MEVVNKRIPYASTLLQTSDSKKDEDEPYMSILYEKEKKDQSFTKDNTLSKNYAFEGKNKDTGKPNGRYFIDRDGAKKAFKPFEEKYLKINDKEKLDDFYKNEFEI